MNICYGDFEYIATVGSVQEECAQKMAALWKSATIMQKKLKPWRFEADLGIRHGNATERVVADSLCAAAKSGRA